MTRQLAKLRNPDEMPEWLVNWCERILPFAVVEWKSWSVSRSYGHGATQIVVVFASDGDWHSTSRDV